MHAGAARRTIPMSTRSPGQFTPLDAVLAWIWPGLGHISRGERRRGLLVMSGVLFLFLSGVLIGGIDSIDRREDALWFMAQALCGPIAFVVDFIREQVIGHHSAAMSAPIEPWMLHKGLGRVNEMGTLYSALAGLMNLVAILDVLYVPTRRLGEPSAAARGGAA